MKYNISESESLIMEVLWEKSPLTCSQIITKIKSTRSWSDNTIKTFISRLRKKGAILAEQREVLYYSYAFTKDEVKINAAKTVMKKIFDGSAKQMVLSFISDGELSNDDIEELKKALENYKKE